MKTMLVMLILGMSIALPGAASAAAGDDTHPDRSNPWQAAQGAPETEPTNLGTVAGPAQAQPNFGPYSQQRLDNRGQ
ncbi:MAG TPA: hypothetical protein VKV57_12395 [bacterium]|nr:hypothetical protein [bacterium]